MPKSINTISQPKSIYPQISTLAIFLSQLNDTNNKSLVCNVLALDCLQKGEFAIARQHLRQFISLEKVTVDTIKKPTLYVFDRTKLCRRV